MDSKSSGIKLLLRDYYFYKMQVASGAAEAGIKETLEIIERCIGALDDENRRIMRLAYYDKTPIKDIANNFCLTRQGLYKRINSVICRIAKCLNQPKT